MADRYWVGGAAAWDTSTTRWSTSSGGASGASVPTTADDAIFDANSGTGVVTISIARSCLSLICTDYSGTIQQVPANGNLTIAGSLTLGVNTTFTGTGTITMTSTGSVTITSNGETLSALNINGTGGTFTLLDECKASGQFTMTAGTFNTNGFDLYVNNLQNNGTLTRTLSITGNLYLTGASTTIVNTVATGLTIPSTTFDIYLTNASSSAKTLTFTSPFFTSGRVYVTGAGTGTYTLALGTTGVPEVFLQNTGGASIGFNASTLKTLDFTGATMTLSAANTVTLTKDLILASGLTISGSPPLILTGAATGTSNISGFGKSLNNTFTINGSGNTFNFITQFTSGSTYTHTAGNVNINATFTIAGAYTHTAGALTINNNSAITSNSYVSSNANVRSLNLGGCTWTLLGTTTVWSLATSTNMTINAGNSNIIIANTSVPANTVTFAGGGLVYYTLTYARTGVTATFTISGSNTFINLLIKNINAAFTLALTSSTNQTVGHFDVSGSTGALITINKTGAAAGTLVKSPLGIVNSDFLTITATSCTVTPTTLTWYAGANSTVNTGNTGWIAEAYPSRKLGSAGVG